MLRSFPIIAVFLLVTVNAWCEEEEGAAVNEEQTADEPTDEPTDEPSDETTDVLAPEDQGDGYKRPKTLSGMSILGNEEAPKSLVIIPWKSSELGDDISLSDTLDERAKPVDKEVFLRELSFYEIRSGN